MSVSFSFNPLCMSDEEVEQKKNKAGYTAQDAPCTRLEITGDGPTDGPTDATSYRAAFS